MAVLTELSPGEKIRLIRSAITVVFPDPDSLPFDLHEAVRAKRNAIAVFNEQHLVGGGFAINPTLIFQTTVNSDSNPAMTYHPRATFFSGFILLEEIEDFERATRELNVVPVQGAGYSPIESGRQFIESIVRGLWQRYNFQLLDDHFPRQTEPIPLPLDSRRQDPLQ